MNLRIDVSYLFSVFFVGNSKGDALSNVGVGEKHGVYFNRRDLLT